MSSSEGWAVGGISDISHFGRPENTTSGAPASQQQLGLTPEEVHAVDPIPFPCFFKQLEQCPKEATDVRRGNCLLIDNDYTPAAPPFFVSTRPSSADSYTALIGPGYCETKESIVSNVTPSTVACATKILSKGSL